MMSLRAELFDGNEIKLCISISNTFRHWSGTESYTHPLIPLADGQLCEALLFTSKLV